MTKMPGRDISASLPGLFWHPIPVMAGTSSNANKENPCNV